ncbi:MAG: hypothetical protein HY660_18440 [Armatimonadetes bacterium]|nr:hypothetical protein [Armatimonadota bacterium]
MGKRVRIQLDVSQDQAVMLDRLASMLSVRSRSDLLHEALATFIAVMTEIMNGRRVVAADPAEVERLQRVREFVVPAALPYAQDRVYEFLVRRPHPWRKQLYLKGRNMTVGQLVAVMNANRWTPETVAEEYDLPVPQVREALVYYSAHRDLVDAELREEAQMLRTRVKSKRTTLAP